MEECNTMRTALYKIKEFIKKKKRERELKDMDFFWAATGVHENIGFPPSFYATHTEEEIKQAHQELLDKCNRIIEEYKNKE
jgi:hypothetical protein